MYDDGAGIDSAAGDEIYSATVPAQSNRTLVRYRIEAEDGASAKTRAPMLDDGSLNFALFVYEGVPDYVANTRSVLGGVPRIHPREMLTSLPVYHLLSRAEDVAHCVALDGRTIPKSNEPARDKFNWEGAFVYEGYVYDHVKYRLRQANDRYGGSGKRSMRFRFRKGNRLRARDQYGRRYPTRWRTLNSGKMFDNKRVGNFGLTETLNSVLWNLVGVPAPYVHTFHLRVVDGVDEAPSGTDGQYFGDFWGMYLAFEDYDTRFLDAHSLEDGNLYKLKDGQFNGNDLKRHQGRYAVTTDEDFQNIRRNLRPERSDAWLLDHVNYDRWYPYHTVCEAIRHYDFRPADSHSKNRAWYFEPNGFPLGRVWTLPHDSDASWGPNWNSGVDYSKNAIYANGGKPAFKQDYRNFIREFRDLVWTGEVIHDAIDDLAEFVTEFSHADRDRWRSAPSEAGYQDFGPIQNKITDMKNFAFSGWSGSTGPTVPAGGRAKHLENLAEAEGDISSIPRTPSLQYRGGYPLSSQPIDTLEFHTTAFSDPQGNQSFAAMMWRVGRVNAAGDQGFDPLAPRYFEYETAWTSGELGNFAESITIPSHALEIGGTYRVRLKMMDTTNRWSHWSDPIEFTTVGPVARLPHEDSLRISEFMYNPLGGRDFEFVEIFNKGSSTLDLRTLRFVRGIEFSFADGDVDQLFPGEYAVIVSNLKAFSARYETDGILIAGEYSGNLDNGGETLTLSYGPTHTIQSFTYDDGWAPSSDGAGSSLEVTDIESPPSEWSSAAGWQESNVLHGSPGLPPSGIPEGGGLQLVGDVNQDNLHDISDAIGILRGLFAGGVDLPCDGDDISQGGNATIFDVNGDGGVDISDATYLLNYLFLGGDTPAGGITCTRIEGCPDRCPRR